jgi:hypothetical protein
LGTTAAGEEFDQFMGSSEWDGNVMRSFDGFLHKTFCKFDKLLMFRYHTKQFVVAQKVCDERALVPNSMQSNPDYGSDHDGSGSESGDPTTGPREDNFDLEARVASEYEKARAANIPRNKLLAEEVDERYGSKYGVLPEVMVAKPERQKKGKRKKDETKDKGPLWRSTRNNQEQ